MTLTVRTVEALQPGEKSYTAWDDELTGFGVRVQPSGLRSYLVNYRAGDRGRKAPNRRIVIGRHGLVTPDQARRRAREILGRVAMGDDRLAEPALSRAMPTLRRAFEDYLAAGPRPSPIPRSGCIGSLSNVRRGCRRRPNELLRHPYSSLLLMPHFLKLDDFRHGSPVDACHERLTTNRKT